MIKISSSKAFFVFTFAFFTFCSTTFSYDFAGGTGEPNDPYQIETAEQLLQIGSDPNLLDKCFILNNDINMAEITGDEYNVIGDESNPFSGIFDGNGFEISNFTYVQTIPSLHKGLFGYVDGVGVEIKNININRSDVNVPESDGVGTLVGALHSGSVINCQVEDGNVLGAYGCGGLIGIVLGTIQQCYSECNVFGIENIGGLVGYNAGGIILNCSANSVVTGRQSIGGLVGYISKGEILNCYSTGPASGAIGSKRNVGGLIGASDDCEISDCFSTGNVMGNENIGGFIGYCDNATFIDRCYATGDVNGVERIGGFMGIGSSSGKITTSHATGNVTGSSRIGGFAGSNGHPIEECFALGNVSGGSNVGGLIGYNDSTGDNDVISNCFSQGEIMGDEKVGGLIGMSSDPVDNCYSKSRVSGVSSVGGLIGLNEDIVEYSYSAGFVTGTTDVGGLIGYGGSESSASYTACFWDGDVNPDVNGIGNNSHPDVIRESTINMRTESTFTDLGWDFSDIWTICEYTNYPRFLWQILPADFFCPDGVDFADYSFFSNHWLMTDCNDVNDCNSTDLDFSGSVDNNDLDIFTTYWLFAK